MRHASVANARANRLYATIGLILLGGVVWGPGRTAIRSLLIPSPWTAQANLPSPISPAQPPKYETVRNRSVLKLEAPSQLEWQLRGTERIVTLRYGFLPEAINSGQSNGADLIVELHQAKGVSPLASRRLDPRRHPDDRTEKELRLILPPLRDPARLVLRIDPGEFGDAAWDWLYVTDLSLQPATGYSTEQFPGFNRAPADFAANHVYLHQKNGVGHLLQTDAPARMTFPLQGGEQHVRIRFGLLPGAYAPGNATDGADFRLELESGESRRTLASRRLDPGRTETDRGPQELTASLAAVPPGSVLAVVIDPGPAGNSSWDWTYVSTVIID